MARASGFGKFASSEMGKPMWVVVLESSTRRSVGDMDEDGLRRLLVGLGELQPVGLHSPDRYAVQLHIPADTHAEALVIAVDHWRAEVARLGGGSPPLYRAEVMTLEEFERDCHMAYGRPDAAVNTTPPGSRADRPGDRLLWQVFHDPLTQLPARELFMNHLELGLQRGTPGGDRQGLLVIKLRGLGEVNQRWGRSAGDEVLVAAVQRLKAGLPAEQAAARIGGDEFAALFEVPSTFAAVDVASAVTASIGEAMLIGDVEVSVLACAGLAFGRQGQGAEALLSEARAALRASEVSGRVEVYRPGLPPAEGSGIHPSAGHDPLGYLLLLQRAAMAANESSSLVHAAGLVVRQVCAHLGWPLGHMYVVGPDGHLVPGRLPRLGTGPYEQILDFLDHRTLAAGEGLAGRVAQTGQPAWVVDMSAERQTDVSTVAEQCGLRAAMAFPVLVGREVVAVLEFFTQQTRTPDDALVEVLRCVGSQLGRVVERRRGQDSIQASEDRMRQAQSLAQLGSWHLDAWGNEGTWTEGMSEILGVGPDAPHTVEYFLQLVVPEDRPAVETAAEELRTTGRSGPVTFRIVRPDGQLRWVSARTNSARDDVGNVVALYGTILDITHVKAVEESLRERERQLNLAEEVAELGSWDLDLLTDRLEWSDGMFRLWGVARDSFVPGLETVLSFVHPEDRERVRNCLATASSNPGSSLEFRVIRPDGRQRWFRGRSIAQCDELGRAMRVVGTVQDITRKRLAEEERRQR